MALLGFGWLRHLRAADTALTRANARSLVDDWISNPGRKRPLEHRADVLARRVVSLLSQAPLVLGDTDSKFYRKYLRGLTREIRYLRYTMPGFSFKSHVKAFRPPNRNPYSIE